METDILHKDVAMENVLNRILKFQESNNVGFQNAMQMLIIVKLDELDSSLHDCTLDICTSLNDIGRGRY